MIINGEEINGKIMPMNKMTTSSQALYNYKHSLLEDYYNNANIFKNSDFYDEVDNRLMDTQFFTTKNEDKKADYIFLITKDKSVNPGMFVNTAILNLHLRSWDSNISVRMSGLRLQWKAERLLRLPT